MANLATARRFVDREARLIDRLTLAAILDSAPSEPILRALSAYQNADGGFGHALEPDTRTASSQPLYFEIALAYMALRAPSSTQWCCAHVIGSRAS
jgi:hypothetical protein